MDAVPRPEPKTVWKAATVPEKSEKYITLRIKPRNLERTVLLLIILVLGGLVFYSPFHKSCPATQNLATLTGFSVQEKPNETAKLSEPVVEAAPPSQPAMNDTITKNESGVKNETSFANQTKTGTAKPADEEGPIDPALVDFTIDFVNVVKKTETWAKVTRVDVTIKNRGYRLRPVIKAYAWDSKTESSLSDFQEGDDWKFDVGIGRGATQSFSIDTSISFSDFDLEKTIKLKLYDSRTKKLVKEAIKKFSID